jgi:hypothetical protein
MGGFVGGEDSCTISTTTRISQETSVALFKVFDGKKLSTLQHQSVLDKHQQKYSLWMPS